MTRELLIKEIDYWGLSPNLFDQNQFMEEMAEIFEKRPNVSDTALRVWDYMGPFSVTKHIRSGKI